MKCSYIVVRSWYDRQNNMRADFNVHFISTNSTGGMLCAADPFSTRDAPGDAQDAHGAVGEAHGEAPLAHVRLA